MTTVLEGGVLRARSEFIWTAAGLSFTERVELVCLLTGTKPLVRLIADDDTVPAYRALAKRLRVAFVVSNVRQVPVLHCGADVYTESVKWSDPRGRWFSIFMSAEAELGVAAAKAEASGANSALIGELLGYPPCCTTAYESTPDTQRWTA